MHFRRHRFVSNRRPNVSTYVGDNRSNSKKWQQFFEIQDGGDRKLTTGYWQSKLCDFGDDGLFQQLNFFCPRHTPWAAVPTDTLLASRFTVWLAQLVLRLKLPTNRLGHTRPSAIIIDLCADAFFFSSNKTIWFHTLILLIRPIKTITEVTEHIRQWTMRATQV